MKMSESEAETSLLCGELVSTGLQAASTRQQQRVTIVDAKELDHEVPQSKKAIAWPISGIATQKPILELGPPPSPKPRVVKPKDKELTVREKWGFPDPKKIPPKPIFSSKSERTIVHQGFGKFMLEKETVVFEERVPFYPPLPNAAYNFLNKGIEPRGIPSIKTSFDGAAFVKEYIIEKNAELERPLRAEPSCLVEQTVEKIDWTRRLYYDEEMIFQNSRDFCAKFWKNDLITAIEKAASLGQESFEMCNRCHKRHIAWGPPIAMNDRDTCLSMLPAWFPAEQFDEPWNVFNRILNRLVEYGEIEQGRRLDPTRKVWDKYFHNKSAEWTALGRAEGGWWKCRSGDGEGGKDVPEAERRCRLCHRPKTKEEEALETKRKEYQAEKVRIHAWIARRMEIQMMKDRAIVEGRIRDGIE